MTFNLEKYLFEESNYVKAFHIILIFLLLTNSDLLPVKEKPGEELFP